MARRPRRPLFPRYGPAALAGLFLFALLWRLAYIARLDHATMLVSLHADERVYWDWATYLMTHGFRGSNPFFFGPLYPYVLAAVRAAVGSSVVHVLMVQALWGAAAAVLIADAARRFAGWWVGLGAGLLYALYEMGVYFDGLVLMESVVLFLEAFMLWWWARTADRRGGAWHFVAIGAVTGLVTLGRATGALLLLPVWFLGGPRNGETWRPVAGRFSALLISFAITVIPAGVHNWKVAHELIPFSYNFGLNLYVGNNDEATGRYVWISGSQGADAVKGLRPDGGIESDGRDFLEATDGVSLSPRESSRYWASKAWRWMRAHPVRVLELAGAKFILLWNRIEQAQIESADMYRSRAGPLGIPLLGTFAFVAVLGLTGAALAVTWPGFGPALCGYLAVFTASMLPFFVTDRYRVHLVPALVLLAALAVHAWRRRPRHPGVWPRSAIPALLATGLVFVPITRASDKLQDMMQAMDMGTRWLDAGRPDLALGEYQKAIAIDATIPDAQELLGEDPRAALFFNYGYSLRTTGHPDEAMLWFRRALETSPENSKFLRTLGDAYLVAGRRREGDSLLTEAARRMNSAGELLISRGYDAAREGHLAEAESLFSASVHEGMRNAAAWGALIRVQVQQQELRRARETVERFRQTGLPPHIIKLYDAFVLAASGESARARAVLAEVPEVATAQDPTLGWVRSTTEKMIAAGGG